MGQELHLHALHKRVDEKNAHEKGENADDNNLSQMRLMGRMRPTLGWLKVDWGGVFLGWPMSSSGPLPGSHESVASLRRRIHVDQSLFGGPGPSDERVFITKSKWCLEGEA